MNEGGGETTLVTVELPCDMGSGKFIKHKLVSGFLPTFN